MSKSASLPDVPSDVTSTPTKTPEKVKEKVEVKVDVKAPVADKVDVPEDVPSAPTKSTKLEYLRTTVATVDLVEIRKRAGDAFDINDLTEDQIATAIPLALHCCLNGPVGVHKVTIFPVGGSTSIAGVIPKITNSQWKAFCLLVAKVLDETSIQVKTCYTIVKFGSLWPLCDSVFTPKKKS
jgi:hypothetical protein